MAVGISRRALIAGIGPALGTVALSGVAVVAAQQPPAGQPAPPAAPPDPSKVVGARATTLGSRSPFEQPARTATGLQNSSARAPIDSLRGIITPSDLHYIVDHDTTPTIDPKTYTLTIHGMVDRPVVFTLDDLQRFPSVSRMLFLECGGNSGWGKQPENATAQAIHGLTSCSNWEGVPVSSLLKEAGVQSGASWALFVGWGNESVARSIPVDKLLDDAFIAYGQNGEALRPEQGYPARLLLPGWLGNSNIKWVRRIELGDKPWDTKFETTSYTTPMPDNTVRQYIFVWEAKSIITWPTPAIGAMPALGPWDIRGLAWSGRGKISKVDVSTDGGKTWGEATLDAPVLPQSHTRFHFPWTWDGSEAVLTSRATDESGYVQPTREELVAVRGTNSRYLNNSQQNWKVAATSGAVTNYYLV
jgi:sulfane dehydrogenase subunit SoxC